MHVVFVTDTEEIGGAERHLADLARGISESGHRVTVLAPQEEVLRFVRDTAPAARAIRTGDRRYHRSSGVRRGTRLATSMVPVARRLRTTGADVLHVNNGGYPGSDLCRLAPFLGRTAGISPRVMTVNSMPWSREASQPQVQAATDRLVWSNVDAVLFPSLIVADAVADQRGMPARLTRHLRYGVRPPAGSGEAAEALRARLAPGGELLVGMVSARPVPEKGYDVFVDALASVGQDVRGVVVGPHLGEPLVERIRRRGVADRIVLEGAARSVGPHYHAMDVLVMPSVREEAMPLVMLEAMAAGRPVIASRLAGTPEAVDDGVTGVLFAPGDASRLAEIIGELADDRERLASMGRRAQERWRALFSPDALVASHLALYEELVGPGVRKTVSR